MYFRLIHKLYLQPAPIFSKVYLYVLKMILLLTAYKIVKKSTVKEVLVFTSLEVCSLFKEAVIW